ncbi:MAG: Fur family transcriptional regulator [Pseudomonadota bacterium]|jgi:Fur family zinc uptake transcriptional regulator|nr:Fur family transcriptional regulator [Pseudomonadota bacterium]
MNENKLKAYQLLDTHDHDACIEEALVKAELVCKEKRLRFTKIRKKVLELIWSSHKPLGAYEILDYLRIEGIKAEPPTVYRALGFLIEADLVHRLDSLNAFIGCIDPDSSHQGQFLICQDCRSVSELDDEDILNLVQTKALSMGFLATNQMLEIEGQCNNCRSPK